MIKLFFGLALGCLCYVVKDTIDSHQYGTATGFLLWFFVVLLEFHHYLRKNT